MQCTKQGRDGGRTGNTSIEGSDEGSGTPAGVCEDRSGNSNPMSFPLHFSSTAT